MTGNSWDVRIFLLANQRWTAAWLDKVTPYLVRLGSAVYLTVAVGLLVWERLYFPTSNLGGEGVASALLAILAAQGAKRLIKRPRPYVVLTQVRCPDPDLFIKNTEKKGPNPLQVILKTFFRTSTTSNRSFPSGHIATVVSLAMVVGEPYPFLANVTFVYALVLGYARIYVGVHFPSDILAGIIIGAGSGLLSIWLI
ncbi:MAG: phosphatase PAP2 family protein [Clostridia bacterium]|nr:phosphatase PAP2 family protein [Clostridia bacterium]